ncbi:MAG: NAD+ synthase [Chitinophagales bacterium]|nr:NAD+ synthase [Chitinophagales bacterium]
MKIALAQLNYHVGNFEANTQKIIDAIRQAEKLQADLVVFSELCVCGYPARDFLEFKDFINQCELAIQTIAAHTHRVAAIVGAPRKNPRPEGKDLFNAAFFLYEGKIQYITDKTLLPTYDVFDEYRYFEPNKNFTTHTFKGHTIAITICEDIWDVAPDTDDDTAHNPLYTVYPLDEVRHQQPQLIINLSASPFSYVQHRERMRVIRANVKRYRAPLIYVNQVGAQTELIFDGGSIAMSATGDVLAQLPFFEECIRLVELKPDAPVTPPLSPEPIPLIHDALILGIRDYFRKLGFQKAILGLSGGIDSAIVLYLATRALGHKNVLSLLMPSGFSSKHSVDDSIALCQNLQSPYHIIPIEDIYRQFLNTLSPYFKDLPFNTAEENIQARIRAVLLMAFSNKFGYILLNTTNKSEAAVGYGTLYGDLCGGLGVLGDVYKTQVYALANYINRKGEIIPHHILTKAPSAELRPNQKDTDTLPPYEILDKILFEYIEKRRSARELIAEGYEPNLVSRVFKMVNTNEWKRFQVPPILRVSPKAFGMGRRMNIEGKYY